jgi:hypothetical protein
MNIFELFFLAVALGLSLWMGRILFSYLGWWAGNTGSNHWIRCSICDVKSVEQSA